MVKKTANPDVSDEFWRDDAVAIDERERVEVTGFRMPAAASSKPTASAQASAILPEAEDKPDQPSWLSVIAAALVAAFVWCLIETFKRN